MEILTFPVGLVIGLIPIVVDLGPQDGPAVLRLDDRPVCQVSAQSPACMVDLGPVPRIHTLDLQRVDARGRVVENLRRYLNRGISGSIRAVGTCDDERRICDFDLQCAHPAKAAPVSLEVTVDGRRISTLQPHVRFADPPSSPPQILTVEATFADGGRAEFTRLLHGSYSEDAEARLRHVEIETQGTETAPILEADLRGAGWRVRTVDQGPVEILFVVEPGAFDPRRGPSIGKSVNPFPNGESIEGLGPIRFLVAGETLGIVDSGGSRPWWRRMIDLASRAVVARVRVADAVAIGGFHLGAAPRRRVLVLVLADPDQERRDPDASNFSPRSALAYLNDARVPIVVWRTGAGSSADWPGAQPIRSSQDLASAVRSLRGVIDRQWIAWLESRDDPSQRALPSGISIAGRPESHEEFEMSSASRVPDSAGPARDVYALAADPRNPSALVAGTADGLFATSDAGSSWRPIASANRSPVFAVAFVGKDGREILAGASGALLHGNVESNAWTFQHLPTVQSLAATRSDGAIWYASARGRLFQSEDGGRRWTGGATSIDAEYTATLAVDPRDSGTVFAGTMGGGVFRSNDRGRSWVRAGAELQNTAVRCITVSPSGSRTLYAGTDGGLFESTSAGARWTPIPGLAHLIVYAIALDPANPMRMFAGTEEGLRQSSDGGRSWTRSPGPVGSIAVTSMAFSGTTLFAGTIGGGVQTVPLSGIAP